MMPPKSRALACHVKRERWAPFPLPEVQGSSLEGLPELLPNDGGPRGAPYSDGGCIEVEDDNVRSSGHDGARMEQMSPASKELVHLRLLKSALEKDIHCLRALVEMQAGQISKAEENIKQLLKRQSDTDAEMLELKTKILVLGASRSVAHTPPAPPPPPDWPILTRTLHPSPS